MGGETGNKHLLTGMLPDLVRPPCRELAAPRNNFPAARDLAERVR